MEYVIGVLVVAAFAYFINKKYQEAKDRKALAGSGGTRPGDPKGPPSPLP